MTTPAPSAPGIQVRRLEPSDSIEALTALLHRAYAAQVAMGLRPLAGRQSPEITRARTSSGECYVAVGRDPVNAASPALVGTILLEEREEAAFPAWFLRPEVAHFSLFAVDPDAQGRGIGERLLATITDRSRDLGFAELALSMAEPDEPLRRYYERRGFRVVERWQWPYTNYLSLIMSRPLADAGQTPPP